MAERKPGVISAALAAGWAAKAMAHAQAGHVDAVAPCIEASKTCLLLAIAIRKLGDSPLAQAAVPLEMDLREQFWEDVPDGE